MAEDLESLSVPELKKILKNKNLPVSGRKSDLIKRLVDENAKDIQISIPLYSENNLWRRLGNKKWELSNGYVISAVHVFVSLMVILSTAGLGAYAVSQFNSKTPDYTLIQFDSSKAREYTQMLVDLGHPEWNGRMSGSVEEQATVDAIQQNFTEMGLMLQYETFNVPMFEIRSEPELSMCVPGEYPFSLQSPTPCGTTDINAEIITFNHLTDFVLQGYSGTREIQFWQDEFTIANLSDGSDDSLWDNASGQVGLLWLDSVGVTSNTEFYAKARDSSLAGLIIAIEKGNTCKLPSLEGTCVPFFKTVDVTELGTMPTDIAFIMVSNDVGKTLSDTFGNKDQNDVRLNLVTDVYNDGTMDVRVPCGVLPGQTDELIIIGGHHDTTYNAPGAVDDSSGVANVLELARQFSLLSNEIGPSYYTIKFCTWGGEEEGLHGSTAYVEMHSIELSEMLRLYVNFDMPHVDIDLETRGNSISFYGNGIEDLEHISNIVEVFKKEQPEISSKYDLSYFYQSDDEVACSSDHCPFVKKINKDIVGSYGGGSWEYHTYLDDMSRFNEESLFVTGTILGSYVLYLGWGE